jgi:TP901 family phage tail tape measure protein
MSSQPGAVGELVVFIRTDDRQLIRGLARVENLARTSGARIGQSMSRGIDASMNAAMRNVARTLQQTSRQTSGIITQSMQRELAATTGMVRSVLTPLETSIRGTTTRVASMLLEGHRQLAQRIVSDIGAFRAAAAQQEQLQARQAGVIASLRQFQQLQRSIDTRAFLGDMQQLQRTLATPTRIFTSGMREALTGLRRDVSGLGDHFIRTFRRAGPQQWRADWLTASRLVRGSLLAVGSTGIQAMAAVGRASLTAGRTIGSAFLAGLSSARVTMRGIGIEANLAFRTMATQAATAGRAVLTGLGTPLKLIETQLGRARAAMRRLTTAIDPETGETVSIGRFIARDLIVLGGLLSAFVTRPLTRAAREAVKVANETLEEINRIALLTVANLQDIPRITESIVKAVRESGLTATDAARGLFFLTSGLGDVNLAMSAMVPLSRASAIGIGTFEEASRSVITVLKNYGAENISVAETLDILTAAASRSVALPSEVGAALQKAVPAAAQLGVEFKDLAAFTALLTPSFASASETGTAVNRMVIELLRGIPKMRREFEALRPGFTRVLGPFDETVSVYERFREEIQDKGLIASLQTFKQAMDAQNIAAGEQASVLARLFGRQTSFRAAMAFMRLSAEDVAKVVDDVADSAGRVIEKYDEWTGTARGRWTLAIEGLRGTQFLVGQEMQNFLVPILEILTRTLREILEAWLAMPGPMRFVIALLGGMTAAIGPLIVAYGTLGLLTSITALKELPQLTRALERTRLAFKGVGIAAAAMFAVFAAREIGIFIAGQMGRDLADISQLAERLQQLSNAARDAQRDLDIDFSLGFDADTGRILVEGAGALNEVDNATKQLFLSMKGLREVLKEERIIPGGAFLFPKLNITRLFDPSIGVTRAAFAELDSVISNFARQGNLVEAARQFAIFGAAIQREALGTHGIQLDIRDLTSLFPQLSLVLDTNKLSWDEFLDTLNEQIEANVFLQSELSRTAERLVSLRDDVALLRQGYVDLADTMSKQFNVFKDFRDTQARINELLESGVRRVDKDTGALRIFERQGGDLKDVTDEVIENFLRMPGLIAQVQQSGGFGTLVDEAESMFLALTNDKDAARGLAALLRQELPAAADEARLRESLLQPGITETERDIDRLKARMLELGVLDPLRAFRDDLGRGFAHEEIFAQFSGDLDELFEIGLQGVLFETRGQMEAIGDQLASDIDSQKPKLEDATDNILGVVTDSVPQNSPALRGPLKDHWNLIENAGLTIVEAIALGLSGNAGLVAAAMTEVVQGITNFDQANDAIEDAGVELTRVLFRGMARGVTVQLPLLNAFALTVAINLQLALFRQNPFIMLAGESLSRSLADGIRRGIFHVESAIRDLEAAINAAIANMQIDGSSITRRLASGIRSGSTSVNTAMNDTLVGINDRLPSSPARLGPLSGAGDPLLAGREIVNRLIEGVLEREIGLSSALNQVLTPLGAVTSDLALPQTRTGGTGFGGGGTTTSSVDQSLNLGGITVVSPRPEAAGRAIVTEVSDTVYLSTGRSLR